MWLMNTLSCDILILDRVCRLFKPLKRYHFPARRWYLLRGFFMSRKCYACKEVKELTEFCKDKSMKGGRCSQCKECDREKKRNLHPLVNIRNNFLARCYNPKNPSFKYYGGRGIGICDEWKNNVSAFVKWGKESGYRKGLQIDRIDNDGNYEPENCRFVTLIDNMRNQRISKWWWVDGIRYESRNDVLEKLGISRAEFDRLDCFSELKYDEHRENKELAEKVKARQGQKKIRVDIKDL